MKAILKSNKIKIVFLLILCFFILFNPITYAQSCLNAVSVWGLKIFPLLFPFFVITRCIVALSNSKQNFMDKFFNKLYNTPNGTFLTYFLSVLSGYPMGAKLISNLYDDNQITTSHAKKMLSICSVSGPMFILGTVGIGIFNSYKAGVIILVSNIIASLINGFIYRGKFEPYKNNVQENANKFDLTSIVYDSLISVLMVAAYVILSFIFIDLLKNLGIIKFLSHTICCVFNIVDKQPIVESTMCGIMEMTRGIIEINNCNIALSLKCIIASGLIGFGGFSVLFQSLNFINKLKISFSLLLKQKFTQGIISIFFTIILALLFL